MDDGEGEETGEGAAYRSLIEVLKPIADKGHDVIMTVGGTGHGSGFISGPPKAVEKVHQWWPKNARQTLDISNGPDGYQGVVREAEGEWGVWVDGPQEQVEQENDRLKAAKEARRL